MTEAIPSRDLVVEWAWSGSALEEPSGDLHVVVPFGGGTLVALLDGLGHGPEAAAASRAAIPLLEAHAHEPLPSVVQHCHEGLKRTRGVAMSVASFDALRAAMSWIGVGNVGGVLLRSLNAVRAAGWAIQVRGGVVGYRLPRLHAEVIEVALGDTLIMSTDGVREGYANEVPLERSPQEIAESILARFGKGTDDAHVVVARYRGIHA